MGRQTEPQSFLIIKAERGTGSQRPTQKLKPKRLVLEDKRVHVGPAEGTFSWTGDTGA